MLTRTFRNLRALPFAFLLILATALPVLAGPFEDAVGKFANDEYSDTEEAIDALATSTNPLAYAIISALQDDRLMADPDTKKIYVKQADGKIKYALSNLPEATRRIKAVRLWKSRWPVEQGYQQMKEELGLDHHEGRSWRGFHHHACLVMLAFGFLALERLRIEPIPVPPGRKGRPRR